ncbi:Histone acetyltransferase type B subunit 2 [Elasticomyces elasticus]|nr:Histone acetyltransferase type B subunit 2 [Elasticomyces elasticus]
MDSYPEEEQELINNKLINEEYKYWKKNAVFLYDVMYSRALEWPTLTTQWLPDKQALPGRNFSSQRILLGTHTSGQAQDYLQIARIDLPSAPRANPADYDNETGEIGGYGAAKDPISFSIIQKIAHPGEVNKARYMPQNPDLIATMCTDGRVLFWDRTKHPSVPPQNQSPNFQIELKGHEKEGFGLNWNRYTPGQLATGSEDNTVRIWDVTEYSKSSKILTPSRTYTHHSATVNDVQFHPLYGQNLLGTVSDDLTFALIDLRQPTHATPVKRIKGHTDAVNSLSFHPKHSVLFATGSADKSIGIWDLRFPEHGKIHNMEGHKESVTSVEWHPHDDAILASSSQDRRIIFWDITRAGMEQTPEDAQDGPPEMLFMHGGHTNAVSDFSWNENDPWVMCSAAEDNLIQCWRAARTIVEKLPPGIPRREVSASA